MVNSQSGERAFELHNDRAMLDGISQSDLLEERLIDFAVRIISLTNRLTRIQKGRSVASQILRSGTAGASNHPEARGAESRADFIPKMRIVQKELNETSVWIRVLPGLRIEQ